MPAEVIGFLREDATYGEKETLKYLRANLPKEHTVYVETPVRKKRDILYPDFIVLTGYGVIVLEVKDWITIERADPDGATIRTSKSEQRRVPNPVTTARGYALALSNELNKKRYQGGAGESIPWSCAAVLANLPYSVITQLWEPWGEEFVLGRDDLDNPDLLQNKLKNTFPVKRMRSLTREELDLVRRTIWPVVEIETPGCPAFVLDTQQEKLVAEPVRNQPIPMVQAGQKPAQETQEKMFNTFFASVTPSETIKTEAAPFGEDLIRNVSVRLVRGVVGSGKTLVLTQRAQYLAAQYPEWKLAIVSFNDELVANLQSNLRGVKNIKPFTFHKLCSTLMKTEWRSPTNSEGWIESHRKDFAELAEVPTSFLAQEITWIKDTGIASRTEYLAAERRGRGRQQRVTREMRERMFDLLEAYNTYLASARIPDWADVPQIILQKMDAGQITPPQYDVVLVDEAQDFAPSWIQVIKRIINPEDGLIFLADDPTQSIYRYFSWKEKGIPVVGRTQRLRVPYRNTYEIYQLAFGMVRDDAVLQQNISEEGMLVDAEVNTDGMRHGPRPLLYKFNSFEDESLFLRSSIQGLLQQGYDARQIAVLNRRHRGLSKLQNSLKGMDVNINTFHAYKGLEFDFVFLVDVQDTFQDLTDDQEISEERRLFYMAITRARQQLTMTYQSVLPKPIKDLSEYMDAL